MSGKDKAVEVPIAGLPQIDTLDSMKEPKQQSGRLTPETILGNRRFEELSASERAEYGRLHKAQSQNAVNALVKNLNRNTKAHGHE